MVLKQRHGWGDRTLVAEVAMGCYQTAIPGVVTVRLSTTSS